MVGDTSTPTNAQILIDADNTGITLETQYLDFKVPNTGSLSINITNSGYTFPLVDGSAGQVLTTNGGGVLSFTSPSGGVSKYSVTSTLNAGTTTITHSLGTTDILVQIKDATGKLFIPRDIQNYTTNTVDIVVSTTETNARIIILG
jgi:hypothetical protein